MRYVQSLILSVLSLWLSIPLLAQSAVETPYFDRAQSFHKDRQLDSATYYARRAIAASRQQRQWNQHAFQLGWLGNIYRQESQFDSALFYLEKALVVVTANPTQDTTTATVYHNLGLYYEFIDQPEQSLQMYQQALDLREKLDPAQPLAMATSYESLADVYRYMYLDYTTAEEYYLKAQTIYSQYQDVSQRRIFTILYSLATTNRIKENYEKALEYGTKAMDIARRLSDRDQEMCLQMLGNIYYSRQDFQQAISFYQQAIRQTVAREGEFGKSLPRRYNNMSDAYLEIDRADTAIQLLNQSLAIYATVASRTLAEDRADTYRLLGNAYRQNRQSDLANLYYQRSLQLYHRIFGKKNRQVSEALEAIAEFHRAQQHYDSALLYYQRALVAAVPEFDQKDWKVNPTVAMMQNNPLVFRLLVKKANTLVDQFHHSSQDARLTDALSLYLLADSLIDVCRILYDREAAKLRFSREAKAFYNRAIQCTYLLYTLTEQSAYISTAFLLIEKSKAMILWDALTDAQTKQTIGVPDSILRQERQLKRQIAYINSQWMEELSRDKPVDARIAQLQTEQYEVGRQQDALSRLLQQQYPQYFSIKYAAKAKPFPTAQRYTARHNTTLLDYFWGNHYIYGISINANSSRFVRIVLSDSLMYTFSTYQLALHDPPSHTLSGREYRAFVAAAHTLYQQLVLPLLPPGTTHQQRLFDSYQEAQKRRHTRSLTIIPDGLLSFLPFGSLLSTQADDSLLDFKNIDYLIRSYSIGYAQSLRVLTQRTQKAHQKRSGLRFLAFSYSDTATRATTRSVLQELPGASQEIDALRAMAEGDVYKGAQATESRFKAQANNYSIVHLAIHGQADTENPNNNRLVFRPEADPVEDGSLHSYELYELRLQADLVVLSTCESGMGKLQLGEGVYSLARGFAYAGCPSVVMSLWKVDDQQTAYIMPGFYRTLFSGATKDMALREAKLRYLQSAQNYEAHPYFWSAFILEGSSSAIIDYQTTRHAVWIVSSLSILYLLLFLRREWLKKRRVPVAAYQE